MDHIESSSKPIVHLHLVKKNHNSIFFFPVSFLSSFHSLQTSGHYAQAPAVRGAQHNHRLRVRWPGLVISAAGRCPEGYRVRRESRRCGGGKCRLWENGHHLPASGAELPWRPHASDRLQQSQRLS